MADTLPPIRRILTGDDADGRSSIVEDGASPAIRLVPERPGYRVTNLWRTGAAPAPVDAPDSIAEHKGVSPPPGGTVLRIIDIPPEPKDPEALRRGLEATFGHLYKDAQHAPRPGEHPGMHRTATVDYAILLEGELVAIMDKDETVMRAGDVLVQRGTNHAWANRSGKPARIAFILVDGKA
ncbi:MAG: cupin domain-containing protein [Comamonadaceae bacterium]|nr:MAG: cupin domain-containing protein [Comamonadaceae bacterium]